MPEQTVTFGYYPHPCDFCVGDISISPLPKHEEAVAWVKSNCDNIDKDWFYAPYTGRKNFGSGEIERLPYPSRVFALPETHCLRHKNADSKEHLQFLIWCFSFFVGMRLTTTEAGFVDSTPLCPGALIEFLAQPIDKAIDLSERFWQDNHTGKGVKIVPAIIHALFLGQNPHGLDHEKFMFLYMALDACWRLFKVITPCSNRTPHARRFKALCACWRLLGTTPCSNQTPHARRFGVLCDQYGIFSPICVNDISRIRNDIVHEAMMFGSPLGFSLGDNINATFMEMRGLACRFLVALLGVQDRAYLAGRIDRQRCRLKLG